METMENITKNAKLIGIGEEGIKTLASIEDKVKGNMDLEKININQDVDKEYVRQLLDGVDVLFLAYSTENRRANDIVKAISYMALERRVLSVGLNSSAKENKEELGVNGEFTVDENNIEKIVKLMNMMIESISDLCTINIDLTDLKEVLASDKGIKYSHEEFDRDKSPQEVADILFDGMKEVGNEFIEKKGIIFVDMDKNHCEEGNELVALNEVFTKIMEKSANTYELIFSVYMRESLDGKARIGLIYN